jgi:hypothetical protein
MERRMIRDRLWHVGFGILFLGLLYWFQTHGMSFDVRHPVGMNVLIHFLLGVGIVWLAGSVSDVFFSELRESGRFFRLCHVMFAGIAFITCWEVFEFIIRGEAMIRMLTPRGYIIDLRNDVLASGTGVIIGALAYQAWYASVKELQYRRTHGYDAS